MTTILQFQNRSGLLQSEMIDLELQLFQQTIFRRKHNPDNVTHFVLSFKCF